MRVEGILYGIDLAGTAAFAVSGALRALPRRPDIVGMTILATAAAVGGGAFRDLLLQRPVVFLRDSGYPLVILSSVLLTSFFPGSVQRQEKTLRYFDAVGLGLFSALTASAALATEGVTPLAVVFLATISGCAGGVIRDLVIQERSLVLENEVYVTPVIFGSAALIAVRQFGGSELAGIGVAMTVTTTLRLLAIRGNWRLPRIAHVRRD